MKQVLLIVTLLPTIGLSQTDPSKANKGYNSIYIPLHRRHNNLHHSNSTKSLSRVSNFALIVLLFALQFVRGATLRRNWERHMEILRVLIFAFMFAIVLLPRAQAQSPAPAPAPASYSDGTAIDQGIAYVLMLVALVLTYLMHPLDASFNFI